MRSFRRNVSELNRKVIAGVSLKLIGENIHTSGWKGLLLYTGGQLELTAMMAVAIASTAMATGSHTCLECGLSATRLPA